MIPEGVIESGGDRMVHDNFFMYDITACKSHRGVKQLLTEDVKGFGDTVN